MSNEIVVKVGGSLFELPDLGSRLRTWLDTLPTKHVLLVPGGGQAADMVRWADKAEQLGEERSHWLALRAQTFNAHMLAARLKGSAVIDGIEKRERAWRDGQAPILDMHAFALADEVNADHSPHCWEATSDSLATRVAVVANISELILLKSCDLPRSCDWEGAAQSGIVDKLFPSIMAKAGRQLRTSIVNLRQWQATAASAAPPQDRAP